MNKVLDNFFVFEGLDGSGKSTQLKLLGNALINIGFNVETTFEPTDNAIGKVVRQALRHEIITTPQALALLYSADRHDHLYNPDYGIEKKTKEGTIVLSDRYFYSSLAYQTVQLDFDYVKTINNYPHPRCVIYLDAPVSLCMERINSRGEAKELFEKEEYLKSVRENFEKAFRELPEGVKLIRIPAELSAVEASLLVLKEIEGYINH
ncbi:MAG: dTMP kinase [Sphaerochaetaceae bacterium]|nr:dTMP kinase [Sphaerochaetaceae bacterium]